MSATATAVDVQRLLARVGFGATPAEVDRWAGRPYAELVSWLVDVPDAASRTPSPDERERVAIERAGRGVPRPEMLGHLESARRWWLERMRTTPYPLEERMTLLWHDHFATGFHEPFPDVSMLMVQNATLRSGSLGRFDALLGSVSLDPAMLFWLDGVRNATPNPNENYARELFELFSLGVRPQVYEERDVNEAARALTGWTVNDSTRTATFVPARHDAGAKVVLGSRIVDRGQHEVHDVVRVALAHDVAPLFVAWKIVRALGWSTTPLDLTRDADPVIRDVAAVLRRTSWDIGAAVRSLLLDDRFRYADAKLGRSRVKSPAEVVVGAARAIGVGLRDDRVLAVMGRMGQVLFAPPDVGGWPVGTAWLAPGAVIARYDVAMALFTRWYEQPAAVRTPLPPAPDLDGWASLLGIADLSVTTKAAITHSFAARSSAEERQASVFALLVTSPEWTVV